MMILTKFMWSKKDIWYLVPGSFVEFFPDSQRRLPVGPALYAGSSDDLVFRFVGHMEFMKGFIGISIPREHLRPDLGGCGTLEVLSPTSIANFEPSAEEVMRYESLERE